MQQPAIATFYDHIADIAKQEGCSVPEALREAGKLGVTALEVSCFNTAGQADKLARELSEAGMDVTTMPSFFSFESDTDVESQAEKIFADAKTIGAKKLLVIPGFIPEGADREACPRQIIDCTKRLGELADRAGFVLTIEDFDNERSPISDSSGMLRFMDAVPGLTACFDTGNFYFAGEDALDAFERLRGRIGHVHLKDRSLTEDFGTEPRKTVDGSPMHPSPVGAGVIPMGELLEKFMDGGYNGPYTIEHYGAEPMLECLKRSVEWLRARLGEAGI